MNNAKEIKSRFRKPFQDLQFTDDYMFQKVLYNNKELCRKLVELLLDVEVERIEYADKEHSISVTTDTKGVRMDVYVRDDKGTIFDLEMQNLSEIELPKRTRFYQTMIDLEHLAPGESYDKLPDSYIVFICGFDPYNKGLPKYEFRELCIQDTSIELGSGTSKVFINAKSVSDDISDDMRSFLDYLCGKEASSILTREIEEGIAKIKAFRPWEAEYMQLHEMIELAERDAKAIGRAEEREKTKLEDVDALVASGLADAAKACEVLGVAPDAYDEHKKSLD